MNFYNVFVYGTLRKRGVNHHLLEKSSCIQPQQIIQGYCLYDYQHHYPYMLEGQKKEAVVGEIYNIDESTRMQLDILEDIEHKLYRFEYLPTYQCYTYLKYDHEVDGLVKISNGDWIEYIKSLRL